MNTELAIFIADAMIKAPSERSEYEIAMIGEAGVEVTIEATEDEAEDLRRSVVRAPYKAKYRARGTTKATKRGCGDWLHVQLIALTLDEEAKPIDGAFAAVAAANGIDVAKWQHLNPGQVRMCGGMALRKVVACNGALVTPDGTRIEAPEGFCIRNGA